MTVKLTWLGHGSWQIDVADTRILLDPFLDQSPTSPIKAADADCNFILLSHGHFDHIDDVAPIAQRTQATVITVVEVGQWLEKTHQLQNVVGMNVGGSADFPFGGVKLTPAWHTSSLPDGSYGGVPVGFLLHLDGKHVYFACDTGLFRDMELIGAAGLDIAVLPIGDFYTMGIEDSVLATKFLQPRHVIPAHYDTWPPIAQDAEAWSARIAAETEAQPVILRPGESFEV